MSLRRNQLSRGTDAALEPRLQLAAAFGGDSQFDVDFTYVNPQLIDSVAGNNEQAAIETAVKIFHGLIISGPVSKGTFQIQEGADSDPNLASRNGYILSTDVGALNEGRAGTITVGRLVETGAVLPYEVLHNLLHLAGVGNSTDSNDVMFTRDESNTTAALQAKITQATADRLTELGYTVNSNFVGQSLADLIQQVGGVTPPTSPASTNAPPASVPTTSPASTNTPPAILPTAPTAADSLGGDSNFTIDYRLTNPSVFDADEIGAIENAVKIVHAIVETAPSRFQNPLFSITERDMAANGVAYLNDPRSGISINQFMAPQNSMIRTMVHEMLHALGVLHVNSTGDALYYAGPRSDSDRSLDVAITDVDVIAEGRPLLPPSRTSGFSRYGSATQLRNAGFGLSEEWVGKPLREILEFADTTFSAVSKDTLQQDAFIALEAPSAAELEGDQEQEGVIPIAVAFDSDDSTAWSHTGCNCPICCGQSFA